MRGGSRRRWPADRRLACSLVGAVLLPLLGVGCSPPEPAEGALLLATLDTHHFCDMDAVLGVRLRAHWQACPATERECEPPPRTVLEGDRYTCPATDAHYDLGVRLTHPGRYRVEAVAELTPDGELVECFVDPDSGDARIELPTERLEGDDDAQAVVVLPEHGPCPS